MPDNDTANFLANLMSGLLLTAILGAFLWYAVQAWDVEAAARRAETEKHVAAMDAETRRIVANQK